MVVFQNKLSNVISGSFIIHQTEQTTSYFVIHPFQKMALCMISAMGKLGSWCNENFLQISNGLFMFSEISSIVRRGAFTEATTKAAVDEPTISGLEFLQMENYEKNRCLI